MFPSWTRAAKRAVGAVLVALMPLIAQAAAGAGFGPLIEARDLAALRQQVAPLILDIRPGTRSYRAGHIPDALHAPYGLFRGPRDNPGRLIPKDELSLVLQQLGLTRERSVVVVHQGRNASDFGSAAWVYWMLKSTGFQELAVLNGGVNAWRAAGLPLQTGPAPEMTPSDISVKYAKTWLATRADVKAVVDGKAQARLVDARPEAFWKGEVKHPAAARAGTLPQSSYFTFNRWFPFADPTRIRPERVRELVAGRGFAQGGSLISFCNTGHWSAINWFALSEIAGLDGIRLYPESMVGWSRTGFDMANVPGE